MTDSKPTTREERQAWASPLQTLPNSYKAQAEMWKVRTRRLIKDVERAHEALEQGIRLCVVFEGALAAGNQTLAGAQWRDFADSARAIFEETP